MPWQEALRNAASTHSLSQLGALLGYSKTTLSQVLNEKYPGDLAGVEAAVRCHLMNETVVCPVIGAEIPATVCEQHQNAKPSTSSPMRMRLYAACRNGCPHSRIAGGANNGN
mgnify:CR=1 FL=1